MKNLREFNEKPHLLPVSVILVSAAYHNLFVTEQFYYPELQNNSFSHVCVNILSIFFFEEEIIAYEESFDGQQKDDMQMGALFDLMDEADSKPIGYDVS